MPTNNDTGPVVPSSALACQPVLTCALPSSSQSSRWSRSAVHMSATVRTAPRLWNSSVGALSRHRLRLLVFQSFRRYMISCTREQSPVGTSWTPRSRGLRETLLDSAWAVSRKASEYWILVQLSNQAIRSASLCTHLPVGACLALYTHHG